MPGFSVTFRISRMTEGSCARRGAPGSRRCWWAGRSVSLSVSYGWCAGPPTIQSRFAPRKNRNPAPRAALQPQGAAGWCGAAFIRHMGVSCRFSCSVDGHLFAGVHRGNHGQRKASVVPSSRSPSRDWQTTGSKGLHQLQLADRTAPSASARYQAKKPIHMENSVRARQIPPSCWRGWQKPRLGANHQAMGRGEGSTQHPADHLFSPRARVMPRRRCSPARPTVAHQSAG